MDVNLAFLRSNFEKVHLAAIELRHLETTAKGAL
jgi:hypothetical protein